MINPDDQIESAVVLLVVAVLEDDSELEEEALIVYAAGVESRNLYKPKRQKVIRDDHFFKHKFNTLSNDQFRQHFRTSRYGFSVIAGLIERHSVFHNKSNYSQMHPAWQLAIALQRLGHYGSRSAVNMVAADVGVSATAVVQYTNRVLEALVSLAPDWIVWPDAQKRSEHARSMRTEGFPGCIGFIDGTTLPLYQKPGQDGTAYFDRKKR
jgi:hypothetical protein